MSLMTETQHEVSLGTLPRVNLLPPEIAETRRFKRIQVGLGATVAGAVGIVALLYISASSGVSGAQDKLDAETAKASSLQAQSAKYAGVTAVYARADAAQAMLTSAMGEEVRYSQLLNDLSLSVPSNVWIKNLVFSQTPPTATGGAPAAGIGTLSVTGVGFNHDDVAVWLESLADQNNGKTYVDPYFSNSTEALLGTRKTVNFTSTATLTPNAYSHRYDRPVGG
jgi:Tfp pilus assembly protein PilN